MKRQLFTIGLYIISLASAYSQGSITLNTVRTTGGNELACQNISLLPGFSFSSADGKSLTLKVDANTCDPYAGKEASLSETQNYIRTRSYTNEAGTAYLDQIQYFDGLGRPMQAVQRGITPKTADLVTYQEYDGFGRDDKSWLPAVASGNNGAYIPFTSYKPKAIATYSDSAYSLPIYETSPLNRVLEQYGPGNVWHAGKKAVRTEYLTNVSNNDTLNCILYTVKDSNPLDSIVTITRSKNYDTGQLYVTRVADEDGNTTFEFKDKLGQVVLSRQIIRNGSSKNLHDTYYIYDDFGNLKAVLPPIASDAMKTGTSWSNKGTVSLLRDYAYLYEYDNRNRCVAKRIPGTHWIYYVYDKADRLIFTQDGEQRKNGIWIATFYDALNRVVLTGRFTGTSNKAIAIGAFDNNLIKADYTGAIPNGTDKMYLYSVTIDGSPLETQGGAMFVVNYYDNYDFLGKHYFPNYGYDNSKEVAGYGKAYGTHASEKYMSKGLLTGVITRQFDLTDKLAPLYSVMYYDNKKQIIQTKNTNHLGGIEEEYLAYNFTGQPIKKLHIHSATGKSNIKEEYTYAYDHAGRLLKTTHQLTEGTTVKPQVTLAENTYDELGRLQTNKANNQANLNTTYTYNIRSWINNITNAHFNETLTYTYNGNISRMQWGQAGRTRAYNFTYDNLSRLKSAVYSGDGNFSTAYSYDKHGNMLTLQRYGLTETSADKQIDNLTMSYAGNQMTNVTDTVADISKNTSMDFKDYTKGTGIEYTYNANGAMSKDLNKGISSITYNSLELPQIIDIKNMNAEGRNEYTYSASGEKLRVVQKWNPNYNSEPIIGSDVNVSSLTMASSTDYVGNKIYEGNTLKRILVDGGYYEGGNYYFYITDHLGNNRIVANAATSVVQSTQYYPFGASFADKIETSTQPYKYNGKELDSRNGLNMYDYSARYKDDFRFTSVDPHAENYYSWSPYAYVGNNPIKRTDPDGKDWRDRLFGALTGTITNIIPGSTGLRNLYTPNSSSDYNNTLKATDIASLVVGGVMIATGTAEIGAGGGMAVGGAAVSVTGVGATAGVPVAAAGGVTAGKGVIDVAAGGVLVANSAAHLSSSYNYGKTSESAGKPGARTEPKDLQEQLTLEEAKGGEGVNYRGRLNDSKYKENGGVYQKKQHNHEHGDGTSTEVHYDVNTKTGKASGFKIKDDTNKKSRGNMP